MLSMKNLNMYFDGETFGGENKLGYFHANYGGENHISVSLGSNDVDLLRENLDSFIDDFKIFMEQVLETVDHNIVIDRPENVEEV